MSFATEHSLLFDSIPLESLFPAGMFDADQSKGSANALNMLRIIETLVKEETSRNALLSRYALLQSFPRIGAGDPSLVQAQERYEESLSDWLRNTCIAIMPQWYGTFLESLSEDELEVFLKNYVHAHELWGHSSGVALFVRTMMEKCVHLPVPVRLDALRGQSRPIPGHLQSRLGLVEQYSLLGKDFVPGTHVLSRPDYYRITIGPISVSMLQKIQEGGWAEGTQPSKKLHALVELASPFYFRTNIIILLEMVGCVIGRATLGKDRLGTVTAGEGEEMNLLLGVN